MEEEKEEIKEKVNQEKPNNKGLIAIIVILLVVCAVLVVMLLQLNNKKEVEKPAPQQNNDSVEMVSASAAGEAQNNNENTFKVNVTDFDLFFLKEDNKEENTVYSPMVMKNVLSMIKDGASGETKAQIEKVLGNYEPKKYTSTANLSIANALFARDSLSGFKEAYLNLLKDKYLAEVQTDSFESPENINKWVSNKTRNQINNFLDDNYLNGKDFVLINTLAIDMNWKNQIHCVASTDDKVPCLEMESVEYKHEKIEGEQTHFYQYSYSYMEGNPGKTLYETMKFDEKTEVINSSISASYNRYDIIKELGEENIRNRATEWFTNGDGSCYKWDEEEKTNKECKYTDEELKKAVDEVVKELSENYGKEFKSSDFLLYTDDEIKSFAKDLQEYNGVKLMYVGIMPKNGRLNSYIDKVTKTEVNNVIRNLKSLKVENFKEGYATIIHGNIPFFKYDYDKDFTDSIKKLGIVDMFDDNKADLSEMVNAKGEFITDIYQKSTIEFSNFGIRAAAVAVGGGAGNTMGPELLFEVPTERIDLTFDKPYMYLILDKDTGEVWFAGTVYNPIEEY